MDTVSIVLSVKPSFLRSIPFRAHKSKQLLLALLVLWCLSFWWLNFGLRNVCSTSRFVQQNIREATLQHKAYLIVSKISGLAFSLSFIRSFMATMIVLALSSAPCLELFSAAPAIRRQKMGQTSKMGLPWHTWTEVRLNPTLVYLGSKGDVRTPYLRASKRVPTWYVCVLAPHSERSEPQYYMKLESRSREVICRPG